ncbi:MAG: twin-arginine translocation signal domain-containing protein [Desulfomonilaceae bacterium]
MNDEDNKISRRGFLKASSMAAAGGLLLGSDAIASAIEDDAILVNKTKEFSREPKSIHTWLESDQKEILEYEVDINIVEFPVPPSRKWLYYFAIQVNFTEDDEWAHGGLQWADSKEFKDSGNLGINWGGGSKSKGYGGLGHTNKAFRWQVGHWYSYKAYRSGRKSSGKYKWGFYVQDYFNVRTIDCGFITTYSSDFIVSAVLFTETGYGVKCDSPSVRVLWRDPRFRTSKGEGIPPRGVADYNGTCNNPHNTNQNMISKKPLLLRHCTNCPRTTPNNTVLWR